jgi:hypothetical protein
VRWDRRRVSGLIEEMDPPACCAGAAVADADAGRLPPVTGAVGPPDTRLLVRVGAPSPGRTLRCRAVTQQLAVDGKVIAAVVAEYCGGIAFEVSGQSHLAGALLASFADQVIDPIVVQLERVAVEQGFASALGKRVETTMCDKTGELHQL